MGNKDRFLQPFVMLWRLKTNKQNREKKFNWGMLNAHLGRKLDLYVMVLACSLLPLPIFAVGWREELEA